MLNALKNNKVLLWGLKVVPAEKLEPYDHGNKNPRSLLQAGKKKTKKDKSMGEIIENDSEEEEEEEHKERLDTDVFNTAETYTQKDLPFLLKEKKRLEDEKDRLDEEQNETDDLDEIFRLGDLSERMEIIIEDIKYEIKKLQDKNKDIEEDIKTDKRFEAKVEPVKPAPKTSYPSKKSIDGKGFKKGSPEALAHAQKMRESKLSKIPKAESPIPVKKGRVVKGSEEAKELGRKLAEAKKAKKMQIEAPKIVEQPKKKVVNKKPWYYIGDIPARYRPATMDEAVKHNMVSEYGKYQVDETKYKFYKNYGIMLSFDLSDSMLIAQSSGIKRRIENVGDKIERKEIEADKYDDEAKKSYVLWEIAELNKERKDIINAYNWLMKEYYERRGQPYEKQKFKREFVKLKEAEKIKEKPVTPPKVKEVKQKKPKKKTIKEIEEENKEIYTKGDNEIRITKDYFDEHGKLKPEKSKELFDKGIMLDKSMYHLDDYRKYIYVPKFNIINNIIEDLFTEYKEAKISKSTSVLKPKISKKEPKEKVEKLPKSEPKVKKSLASEVVREEKLTPELEEEHGIIEYLKLEPEDEEDEMMKEMADNNNNARAKQIEQLSRKLGIKFIDPNINIKA